MSKKGNCCAQFEIADCRGCHCHVLLEGHPCSLVDKAKELGWSYGDEEDKEEEGLGGGRCGRERMFYLSSNIYSL